MQVLCRSPRTNLDFELLYFVGPRKFLCEQLVVDVCKAIPKILDEEPNHDILSARSWPISIHGTKIPKSFRMFMERTLKNSGCLFSIITTSYPIYISCFQNSLPDSCPNFTMVNPPKWSPKMCSFLTHFWSPKKIATISPLGGPSPASKPKRAL